MYSWINSFYSIPIYRLSYEQRLIEEEKEKTKNFELYKSWNKNDTYRNRSMTDEYYYESNNYKWFRKRNEIIWYIELHIDFWTIFWSLIIINSKKISRQNRNKKFIFKYRKIIELSINMKDKSFSAKETTKDIIDIINIELKKNYISKWRYIDYNNFIKIWEILDWFNLCHSMEIE